MKKKMVSALVPVALLALSVSACAGQGTATTQAVSETSAAASESSTADMTESTAAEGENTAYVYAKLNIPYADFYYGELYDIQAEANPDSLKAQTEAEDAVAKAGLRETGYYDAVSSPTLEKGKNFKASYHEIGSDSAKILGASGVNVAISKALYEDAQKAIAENKEAKNPLLDFVGQMTQVSETAPAEYKVLNSDGSLSKTIGTETVLKEASAEITTTSRYGNYEILISGIEDIDPDMMQGAVLETSDGAKYGLKHLDNLWTKATEIAFSAAAFTDVGHDSPKEFARFADMQGKTVSKITYLMADGDDLVVETELFCKHLAPAEYSVTGDESVAYGAEGTKVNYTLSAADSTYTLSRVIFRRSDADVSLVNTDTAGVLTLPKDYTPGSYQFVFSNEKYSDLSFVTMVESGLKAEDFSFSNNTLSLKENDKGLNITQYINSTNAAKVGETEYKGGRGRRFGKTAFNEDGSIKLDATFTIDEKEVKIFEGADSYPVTIQADGYPDVSFEVVP